MSFDLYVIAPDGPQTLAEMRALMDEGDDGLEPMDPENDPELAELQRARPDVTFHRVRADADVDDDFEFDDLPEPGPQMAAFVAELENRWTGLEDDPHDLSPWSSWPLWQPEFGGRALALNIRWSRAGDVPPVVVEIAARHGLRVYDPQADEFVGSPRRGLLRRFRRR
jgi:hypothetical protein